MVHSLGGMWTRELEGGCKAGCQRGNHLATYSASIRHRDAAAEQPPSRARLSMGDVPFRHPSLWTLSELGWRDYRVVANS
jgi:hypothetical protein